MKKTHLLNFIYGVLDVGSIEPPEGEIAIGDEERQITNIPGVQ